MKYGTREIEATFGLRVVESCWFRVQLPDAVSRPDRKDTRARAFQNSGLVDKDTGAVKGKKQGLVRE
jgi:hypothetical protein